MKNIQDLSIKIWESSLRRLWYYNNNTKPRVLNQKTKIIMVGFHHGGKPRTNPKREAFLHKMSKAGKDSKMNLLRKPFCCRSWNSWAPRSAAKRKNWIRSGLKVSCSLLGWIPCLIPIRTGMIWAWVHQILMLISMGKDNRGSKTKTTAKKILRCTKKYLMIHHIKT